MNILEALDDPQLFGRHFAGPSWRAWRTVLAALFGLPFHGGDLRRYRNATGRTERPSEPFKEAWLVVGRRGGKGQVTALVAVFLGCFRDYAKRGLMATKRS